MFFNWLEYLVDPLGRSDALQPPKEIGAFFGFYLWPMHRLILATLFFTGVAAVSEIYLYSFLGDIVDWMAISRPETFFEVHSTQLLVMTVVIAIIRPLSTIVSRAVINLSLAPTLANRVRWQNYRYVLRQSLSFFQNDFAGRIAQKVMQTGHSLREAVINVIDGVWLLLIYLVGIVVLFSDIDQRLLWPVAIWVIAYSIVVIRMVPPVRAKSAALSEASSSLIGRVVDSYTNIQSVKLFSHADHEEQFVAEGVIEHTRAFQVLMRAIVNMAMTLTLLNTALVLSTAALSIWLWQQGAVSIGTIAVANGLIIRLNQMSGWILRTITLLFENIGTVQNGIETIAKDTVVRDVEGAPALTVSRGEVIFDNVSFHYDGAKAIIRDFSLAVKPGEKIGLVGRSGAGKSTLVNLLLRFYDVDSGEISIDGQNIASVQQESLRESIAMVTQDTSLLHRSIRDNIRYGRAGADPEEIEHAALLAEASDFIPDLIDQHGRGGYEAHVGERGVKLSGGQRQRIAIARVILKNAPILVLDEATSALDSEVELAIQQQLHNLMDGKTVIAIAHRLSTIAELDRLVVIDEGGIVEQGTHRELVQLDGLYAQLWKRQSGGFLGLLGEQG
ncbi:MAG: ABC transporter ATP-binding protein [Gammaproteobacteria bacterium]|nr:ABC transporter ATP-binding protein [Gammaproteobacteria bacterium]